MKCFLNRSLSTFLTLLILVVISTKPLERLGYFWGILFIFPLMLKLKIRKLPRVCPLSIVDFRRAQLISIEWGKILKNPIFYIFWAFWAQLGWETGRGNRL